MKGTVNQWVPDAPHPTGFRSTMVDQLFVAALDQSSVAKITTELYVQISTF